MIQQYLWKYDWYQSIRSLAREARAPGQIVQWERNGRAGPPPHAIKQRVLREYGRRFGLPILVETGTYHGDMIAALLDDFEEIISIELSEALHRKACWRFRAAQHVRLVLGDSGEMLGQVVRSLPAPALFWLDGHYSSGPTALGATSTPIYDELRHVLSARERRHVVVIDDARCFGVERDYPSIDELSRFVRSQRPDLRISVEADSIRIEPYDGCTC